MLEYLDPYHWPLVDLVPNKQACWLPRQYLYNCVRHKCRYVVCEHDWLSQVVPSNRGWIKIEIAPVKGLLGIGSYRGNKEGDYEIPILTATKPLLLVHQPLDGRFDIKEHPGPPSVFYSA
jgi:hypothetical protein